MEALELFITFILVVTVFLAILYRQTSKKRTSSILRQPIIKVRDPTIAQQALIDQADAFSNRPSTPFPIPLITGRRHRHGITTVPYGPHWRALRSNLTVSILQPWRQGLLAPLQREAIDALVTGLSTRGAGDVVIRDSIYSAVFSVLTSVCFGDDVGVSHIRSMELMMQEFRVAIGEARVLARSTMAKIKNWRQWRRFLSFRTQQEELFVPLINTRRQTRRSTKHGTCPYVDSLIDLRIPDENDPKGVNRRALTDDEMVSLIVEFLGAVESIVAVVEWTLAQLVTQPEIQRKLRHELVVVGDSVSDKRSGEPGSYLHAVVLESLRLHPPFPLIMREVRSEGTVVGAATVPAAGMRVQFMLGDIGKDEKVWTEAEEFRPERFLAGGEGGGVGLVPGGASKEIKMMPFGAGQRSCPGAALGVQFIKDLVAALVREFEWEMTAEGGGVDMTELYGFITVMKSPLRTHISPLCA